ncbi:MAG: polysaccharide pyruvyl transferase family protein [Bacilli bacterium]|nr:polysaccharide pyruvyl transferase family protein [Bacilli bacterium]MBQ6538675.1 polysaccharide pyruvyl transferase family protein [Bacilli bacterium]
MNILIVSFFDDNYGDMLIRICFKNLLKAALHNKKITDYSIDEMALKSIDEEKIKKADVIFFAGGGLFGLSYLSFAPFLDKITEIAEKEKTPVVFSSIGINNMDSVDGNNSLFEKILNRKNIKHIAVRENKEFFDKYSNKKEIREVCDPGLWTRYIYGIEKNKGNKCIGINVVRGGLFKDNDKEWTLQDEMDYLSKIKNYLDKKGLDYRFYTNGSLLDNNALRYFAKEYNVPEEKTIYPQTTKEFVECFKYFDATFSIRMHSAIVSYSLDIPAFNIVWNDKLRYFYKAVNHPDRAIEIKEWSINKVATKFNKALEEEENLDKNYLMSLYDYLFDVIEDLFPKTKKTQKYNFQEVTKYLKEIEVSKEEDYIDMYYKLSLGENRYLSLFDKDRKKGIKITELKEEIKDKKEEIKKLKDKVNKKEEQLQRIYNKFPIRVYRKIKRTFKRKKT